MVTWRARIIDSGTGKAAKGEDELSFRNGKFYSAGCAKWGFGDGVYTATARVEGDSIHFESEISSPKHGKIVRNERVKGDIMEATSIWTKERWYWKDARRESWFKGTLKR
jgi:hypothetical protein